MNVYELPIMCWALGYSREQGRLSAAVEFTA